MQTRTFQLESFVGSLTGRSESLLTPDLKNYEEQLTASIQGKRVLVLGGAGTIGSSFVKAITLYGPGH